MEHEFLFSWMIWKWMNIVMVVSYQCKKEAMFNNFVVVEDCWILWKVWTPLELMKVNSFILHPSCMFGLKFRNLPLYCMFSLIFPFFKFSNTLEVAERFYVHMLLSSLPKRFVCVSFLLKKCMLKCMLWFFPSFKL